MYAASGILREQTPAFAQENANLFRLPPGNFCKNFRRPALHVEKPGVFNALSCGCIFLYIFPCLRVPPRFFCVQMEMREQRRLADGWGGAEAGRPVPWDAQRRCYDSKGTSSKPLVRRRRLWSKPQARAISTQRLKAQSSPSAECASLLMMISPPNSRMRRSSGAAG